MSENVVHIRRSGERTMCDFAEKELFQQKTEKREIVGWQYQNSDRDLVKVTCIKCLANVLENVEDQARKLKYQAEIIKQQLAIAGNSNFIRR